MNKQVSGVAFDPEIKYQVDIHIAKLARRGAVTNRSAIVNKALREYLQNHPEESEEGSNE